MRYQYFRIFGQWGPTRNPGYVEKEDYRVKTSSYLSHLSHSLLRLFAMGILCLTMLVAVSPLAFASGASITLTHYFGPPTLALNVNGTGYGASETVSITFDGVKIGHTITSGTGTFSKKITVPSYAQPGNHTILAKGAKSHLSASAIFLVRSNWAQFGFAAQGGRYNQYENTLNTSNVSGLTQDWTASHGGGVAVFNGIAYVAADKLYAFDATGGTLLWSASTGSGTVGSPAVNNNIVYVASDQVYAFNAQTGSLLWTGSTAAQLNAPPTVYQGVVYVTSFQPDDQLYAFNAQTGAKLWSTPVGGGDILTGATVANGIAYVGSAGFLSGELSAFNASTGSQLWTALNGISEIEGAPAVINGVLYVGSTADQVYALNPQTGAQIWTSPTGDWVISSLAVAHNTVYASCYDGKLYAFNAGSGTQLWAVSVGAIAYSSPAVANGVVYITSSDGHLYALDAQTGASLLALNDGGNTTPPVVDNGIIYTTSSSSSLSAYHLASSGSR